jgi:hypothetical protein
MPKQDVIEIRNPKELTKSEARKPSEEPKKSARLRGGLADRDLAKSNKKESPTDEFETRRKQFFV